ncbi:hypothetical protein Gohar_010335, partial [Gossypium harknessii]|nr:hypothetical protein [Gossypium harknessii]
LQGEKWEARVRDTKRGEEEGGDNGEGRREKREELPIDSLLGSQYCRRLGKQLWGRSGLKINDGEEVAWKIDVDANDPVLLLFVDLWVQIHYISHGLVSKAMATQFGNFMGEFVEYDPKVVMHGIKRFMHIRVKIDICVPLKRKKKIIF